MVNTTTTNFDPALKQIYRQANLNKVLYKKRPLFGMLDKFEGFGGRNMPVVLVYGDPQGVSSSFSTAQANASQVRVEDFLLTCVSKYSVARIDSEVIEATRGDNMAFLAALKAKIDGAINALANSWETDLFRSGTGSIARISGTPTAANPMVVTIDQIEEITNFELGMQLVANDTDNGTTLRATPAVATINAVDRVNGTLTTDFDNSGPTTDWAANDYLFREGDPDSTISGLDAWMPATVTATAFFGVDRTQDSRLAGLTFDGTNDTLEDAYIGAQNRAAREDGSPDCIFHHHVQQRRLIQELGAKKEYTESNARSAQGMVANVGYRGVVIQGDEGPIEVYAANKCQVDVGWVLSKDVWSLNTLGPAPKFLMEDGLRILRISDEDAYEVRLVARGNLSSKLPSGIRGPLSLFLPKGDYYGTF